MSPRGSNVLFRGSHCQVFSPDALPNCNLEEPQSHDQLTLILRSFKDQSKEECSELKADLQQQYFSKVMKQANKLEPRPLSALLRDPDPKIT